MFDPSDLFLESLTKLSEEESEKEPELDPIDPGEAAIIGATAISGNILAKGVRRVGGILLGREARKGSVAVPAAFPAQGLKYPAEYLDRAWKDFPELLQEMKVKRKHPVMGGLLPLQARPPKDAEELVQNIRKLEHIDEKIRDTDKVVRSFIDKYDLPQKGVRIDMASGFFGKDRVGPRYSPASKRVSLPSYGKEVALHELGHAADFTGSRIGKIRGAVGPIIHQIGISAIPVALMAGDEIAKAIPGSVDDRAISFLQENAPSVIAGTLAATTLYPEAKASILALKHIAEKEGDTAMRESLKRLGPAYGKYLLSVIPTVAGYALARKFMRQARKVNEAEEEARGQAKQANAVSDFATGVVSGFKSKAVRAYRDLSHLGQQGAEAVKEITSSPDTLKRITEGAKNVGTSPEFVHGAIVSAVPASLAALYIYGTQSGDIARERMGPVDMKDYAGVSAPKTEEELAWRRENPKLYAGLVGLGAALAGGVLTKFVSDVGRVL